MLPQAYASLITMYICYIILTGLPSSGKLMENPIDQLLFRLALQKTVCGRLYRRV